MKLTQKAIENIRLPAKDKPYYKIFHDDDQRGLALRVTSNGAKTFIINRKVNGKVFRMNIGRFGADYTLVEARKRARILMGQISEGIDPSKKQKQQQFKKLTLQQAYDDYIKTRKKLKERSKADYNSLIANIFADWKDKPLTDITRQMVSIRHAKAGEKHEARANNAFKLLNAIFNVAIYQYADSDENSITDNPVQVLTQTKAWFKKKHRMTKINHKQLPKWFKAIHALHHQSYNCIDRSVKHYLLLLLFTGLRKEEAAPLLWADTLTQEEIESRETSYFSLEDKIIFIDDSKNGQEHTLPLSDYIYQLFKAYRKKNKSHFVFPGRGETNYIQEPRKVMDKIANETKTQFTLHDLRRTFATMANEVGTPAYTIKRLLNHKTANNDVTAGYIVNDMQYLKAPVNRIANYIVEIATKAPEENKAEQ